MEGGLETGALYAVLYYRGDATSWHWSLFLPNPSVSPIGKDGTSFQVGSDLPPPASTSRNNQGDDNNKNDSSRGIGDSDTPARWHHYGCSTENIVDSPRTVLCVKLGEVLLLGTYADAVEWLDHTLSNVPVVSHPSPSLALGLAPCTRNVGNTIDRSTDDILSSSEDDHDNHHHHHHDKNLSIILNLDLNMAGTTQSARDRRSHCDSQSHEWTCRAWFLAAVADLHDLGILSCHNVTMLEQEIKNRAVLATMSFVDWGWTTVCTSKHCS